MCTNSGILILFKIINTLILVAKIALPLIIIIKTIIDIGREAIGSSDYKNAFNKFLYRLIAAILVFFVPTIVNTLISTVGDKYDYNSVACLLNVTDEDIQNAYIVEAEASMDDAKKDYASYKYDDAKFFIDRINDTSKRKVLLAKLDYIKETYAPKKQTNPDYVRTITTTTKKVNNNSSYSYTYGGSYSAYMPDQDFKYYKQCGSPYGTINGYDTCNCGCGFVSLAMVVDNLNNTTITPIGVVSAFPPSTYASGNCAINDSTLVDGRINTNYGISVKSLFGPKYTTEPNEVARRNELIVSSLRSGSIIILHVPGHYIVLGGINGNEISVYDPANSVKTRKYTVEDLYNNYKNHKNRCERQGKCGFYEALEYRK